MGGRLGVAVAVAASSSAKEKVLAAAQLELVSPRGTISSGHPLLQLEQAVSASPRKGSPWK